MHEVKTLDDLVEEARAVVQCWRRERHAGAAGRWNRGQQDVLIDLDARGPQTVPSLARARQVSRQHIQVQADRLAEAGLVEFSPNPNHRRSELVQLTDQGRALIASLHAADEDDLNRLRSSVQQIEIQACVAVLRKIRLSLRPNSAKQLAKRPIGTTSGSNLPDIPPRPSTPGSLPSPVPEPSTDDEELPINLL